MPSSTPMNARPAIHQRNGILSCGLRSDRVASTASKSMAPPANQMVRRARRCAAALWLMRWRSVFRNTSSRKCPPSVNHSASRAISGASRIWCWAAPAPRPIPSASVPVLSAVVRHDSATGAQRGAMFTSMLNCTVTDVVPLTDRASRHYDRSDAGRTRSNAAVLTLRALRGGAAAGGARGHFRHRAHRIACRATLPRNYAALARVSHHPGLLVREHRGWRVQRHQDGDRVAAGAGPLVSQIVADSLLLRSLRVVHAYSRGDPVFDIR